MAKKVLLTQQFEANVNLLSNTTQGTYTMAARLGNFIIFIIFTVITLGLYPLYFFVSRAQEQSELARRQVTLLEQIVAK